MAGDIRVRSATVDDVDLLHRFSIDLATYEDEPHAVTSTPQTLARDGFGKNPQFAALIAERGGKPVGFALYTFNYSVWTAARGIFIEDIWVIPEERRGGVARALMVALAQECAAKGYKRIDLNVLDWNPARGFYEKIGFRWIRNWLPYRLSGEALEKLAHRTAPLQWRSCSDCATGVARSYGLARATMFIHPCRMTKPTSRQKVRRHRENLRRQGLRPFRFGRPMFARGRSSRRPIANRSR